MIDKETYYGQSTSFDLAIDTALDPFVRVVLANPTVPSVGVKLPSVTRDGLHFFIYNTSSAYALLLKDSAGVTLETIPIAKARVVFWNGSQWSSFERDFYSSTSTTNPEGPGGWEAGQGTWFTSAELQTNNPTLQGSASPCISLDGSKFLVVDNSNIVIYQYALPTVYTISSASLTAAVDLTVISTIDTYYAHCFSHDGLKLYALGKPSAGAATIYEYTLTVPWHLPSISYTQLWTISGVSAFSSDSEMQTTPDGGTLIVSHTTGFHEFDFGTVWGVSTLSFTQTKSDTRIGQGGLFVRHGEPWIICLESTLNNDSTLRFMKFGTEWDVSTLSDMTYTVDGIATIDLRQPVYPATITSFTMSQTGDYIYACNSLGEFFQWNVVPSVQTDGELIFIAPWEDTSGWDQIDTPTAYGHLPGSRFEQTLTAVPGTDDMDSVYDESLSMSLWDVEFTVGNVDKITKVWARVAALNTAGPYDSQEGYSIECAYDQSDPTSSSYRFGLYRAGLGVGVNEYLYQWNPTDINARFRLQIKEVATGIQYTIWEDGVQLVQAIDTDLASLPTGTNNYFRTWLYAHVSYGATTLHNIVLRGVKK